MSIDHRIVQLQFNNREFEERVQDSLVSLDKLKKGLDLSSSAAALETLNKESNKIDMSRLTTSIETITDRLSNMGLIGIFALQRITNSAIDTGIALAKSLSIGPISSGWSKYEEKTGSVQTLVNSTGLSVEQVNEHLNKLMWFSDETSYGFTDMTKALSTMVTSGGDINKLIPLIQGVANATAFAGKGATEFSRIMYNLNQSYSAGYLSYMDWRSVELQGGNSKALVQTIIDAGVAMKKIKKGQVTLDNFSTTLNDKWADRSVMERAFGYFSSMSEKAYEMVNSGEVDTATEAYAILAEQYDNVAIKAAKSAQEAKSFAEAISATKDAVSSGWMNSFEIIFGNYEEAKKLWTDLAYTLWDIFASGASARNALLSEWKELGGRDKFLQGISNIYKNISNVVSVITRAFHEFFPPTTVDTLTNITDAFVKFTEYITLSNYNLAHLKRGFRGVFAILDAVMMGVKNLGKWFVQLIVFMEPAINEMFRWIAYFGDLGVEFATFLKTSSFLADTFQSIYDHISPVIPKLVEFYNEIKATVLELFKLIDITIPIEETFKFINDVIGSFLDGASPALANFTSFLGKMADSMRDFRTSEVSSFKEFMSSLSGIGNPFLVLYGVIAKIFDWIKEAYVFFEPYLKVIADAVMTVIGGIITVFKDAFKGMSAESFIKVINGFLAGGLLIALTDLTKKVRDLVSGNSDVGIVKNIVGVLKEVKNSLVSWQESLIPTKIMDIAKALVIIAIAVGILSMIDPGRLDNALAAITILFLELVGSLKLMNMAIGANDLKKLPFMVTALISMSVAILILSKALKEVATLEEDELARGLLAIGGFAALISVVFGSMSKYNSTKSKSKSVLSGDGILKMAVGMIAFAYALSQIAKVAVMLGNTDPTKLGVGFAALTGILAVVTGFLHINKKLFSKLKPDMGQSLLMFAIGVRIMASAVELMGGMDPWKLATGLGGLAAILAGITVMLNFLSKDTVGFAGAAVSITMVAGAIYLLTGAVALIGLMSVETLIKGLSLIAGLMLFIAGALYLAKDSIPAAIAIGMVAVAINMLVPAIAILGALPIEAIGGALLILTGIFILLGVATYALTSSGLVIGLMMIAGALLMMGTSVYLTGAGLIMMAAGILALAGAWAVGGKVIMQMIRDLITIIPEVIKGFFIGLFQAISVIFTEFRDMVIQLIVLFFGSIFKVIFDLIADFIVNLQPLIDPAVRFVMQFVDSFLRELAARSPSMAYSVFKIIKVWIDALAANIGPIIDKAIQLVIAFVNGVALGVRNNLPALREAAWNLIKAFIMVIFGVLGDFLVVGGETVWAFIDGVGKALGNAIVQMGKAAWSMVMAFINTVNNMGKQLITMAKNMVEIAVTGIINTVNGAEMWKKIVNVGQDLISGFIKGITNKADAIVKAATNVFEGAVDGIKRFLGIKSPSRVGMEIGEFLDMGFIKGLNNMKKDVVNASKSVGDSAVKSLKASLSLIEVPEDDLTPVIRPVLDLEDFNRGLSNLKKDVSNDTTLDIATTKNGATNLLVSRSKKEEEISQNGSGSGSVSTTYNVKLDGVYYIREEADIKKISQELAVEIERQRRA